MLNFYNLFKKRLLNFTNSIGLVLLFLTTFVTLQTTGQVNVSASGGTGSGSYTTLNAAFTAINAGTHQGVINIAITGNTTEPTTPVPLLKSASPSSYSSINIYPSGGNFIINSASVPTTSRGIIELHGADNVTIDGDDPSTSGLQNLSIIVATNTSTATAAIVLGSKSTTGLDGATNNTIKNCIITGGRSSVTSTTSSYGIVFSNNATATTVSPGSYSNTNVLIQNNLITRAYHGIYAAGANATYSNYNLQVLNNILGSATSANNIGSRGVYVTYSSDIAGPSSAIIDGNDIRAGDYSTTGYSATIAGIEIGTVNAGCIVKNNKIHDISQPTSSGYGSYGITITGSANNTGINIFNNFIWDITAYTYSTTLGTSFENYGLFISAGATNINFNHNSISLQKANNGSVANTHSACVAATASGVTFSKFLNNILANTQASTLAYGVYTTATGNISGAAMNNNDYYIPSGKIGYYNATSYTSLPSWVSATGKDAASINVNPPFVSSTDLHITAGSSTPLESNGASTATTGVTTDIDGQTRPGPAGSTFGGGTAPDIGADEFDGVSQIVCGGPGSPVASAVTTTSATITWTASSSATQYQWELRTGGSCGTVSPVQSGTTNSLSVDLSGLSSSTTYTFCVRSDCGGGAYSSYTSSTFNTPCQTAILPYIENFNGVTPPALPNCTSKQDVNADGSTWKTITAPTGYTGNVLNYSYNLTNAANDWFFTNGLDLTGGTTYTLSYKYGNNSSTYTEKLEVKYGTAANATSMTNSISTHSAITGGTVNTATVTFTPATSGVYYIGFRAYSIADQDQLYLDDISVALPANCTGSSGGTASVSSSELCGSTSSTTLSATGYSSGLTTTYQWQYSNDNFASDVNNLSGQTNPASASTGVVSSTTYYRLKVTCGSTSSVGFSNTVTVTVNNPVVLSTTPGERCGAGTVNLEATSAAGTTTLWYSSASGGTALATGNTFTTPSISTTTTYYVSAATSGTSASGGKASTIGADGGTTVTDAGLVFNATSPFILNTVKMYPQGAGTITIQAVTSTGSVIASTTATFTGATSTGVTVPLNFSIPVGTAHRLVVSSNPSSVTIWRDFSSAGVTYPYSLGTAGSITGGYFTGSSGNYYFFYNWQINSGCEGSRTPVVATVNTAPAVSIDNPSSTICEGASVTLTANSSNPNYVYTWTPGNLSGASQTVSPSTTTTYTVNAVDNSGGAANGCSASANTTITVNPAPTGVTADVSSNIVCGGSSVNLTATSSPVINNIISQNFNSGLGGWTTVNSSTGGTPANAAWTLRPDGYVYSSTTYKSNDNSQFIMSNSDAQGTGGSTNTQLVSPAFSTVGYSAAGINFYQYYNDYDAADFAYVEASLNGSSWTTLQTYTSDQGSAAAFVNSTANLTAPFLNQPTVYVRFRYVAVYGFYWAIDNVKVSGTGALNTYAWTSSPEGFFSSSQNPTGVTPTENTLYTVTVSNNFGCTTSASTGVLVEEGPSVDAGPNQSICHDGSVSLNGSFGGNASNATWTSAGDGTFSNSNSMNATYQPGNGDRANGFVVLTLTTNDPAGPCNAASDNVIINIKPQLLITVTYNPIACYGGSTSITVSATGGTPPYSGTGTFGGVLAGSYTGTVTDASNCSTSESVVITEPAPLTATVVPGTINCHGGTTSVVITASGGTAPYSGTGLISGVSAGTHNYTITDDNGCSITKTITIEEPTQLVVTAVAGNISCHDGTTSVVVAASGGTGPYTGTGVFNNVSAGTHEYTVTDDNGCSVTKTITIEQPAQLVATAVAGSISCFGGTTSVVVGATGGTSPYSGTGIINNVPAGTHEYTVTDDNGCSVTKTITIEQPAQLVATAVAGSISCFGGTTSVVVGATGGTSPYSGTGIINNVPAGTHEYTVTDDNGCSVTKTITIEQPSQLVATAVAGSISCFGGTTSVAVGATGGTSPYSGTGIINNVPAGTHEYTVTDDNGCSVTKTITIEQPSQLVATAVAGTIQCVGGTTTVAVGASGGTAPYSGTGVMSNVSAGTYTYTVTDDKGCTATKTITVSDGTGTAPAKPGDITGPYLNLCGGGTFTYKISAVSGATSYTWIVPSGFTVQNLGTTAKITIPSSFSTKAVIGVRANNNCGSSAVNSLTLYAVSPDPSTGIVGPSNVAPGSKAFYSLPAGAGVTYTWVAPPGSSILSGQGTNRVQIQFPNSTGSGFVKVTVSNACGSSPQGKKAVTVGGAAKTSVDVIAKTTLKAYPNPTQSIATVVFSSLTQDKKFELIVTDMRGKELLRKSGFTMMGQNMTDLDFSRFANGMYLVSLVTENKVETLKMYKEN